jgi:hypothetical protein
MQFVAGQIGRIRFPGPPGTKEFRRPCLDKTARMGIPARQQIAELFHDVPTEHYVQKMEHAQFFASGQTLC